MSHSASSWVQALTDQPLPALSQNINKIRLLLNSGSASLTDIGRVINRDPGLASLFFRHINKSRLRSNRPLISTIESSLNLLGSEAIHNLINQASVLEEQITSPEALKGWYRLILRNYHAARLAQDWASRQSDRAPSEVFIATFLMGIGEFCVAAIDNDKFVKLMERQPRQLKQSAELELLDVVTRDIGEELSRQWGLPELLQDALNPLLMLSHRVQLCTIAQTLAYEADLSGWNTEAMRYCYEMAAGIQRQPLDVTTSRVHELSVQIAREMELPGVRPAAAWLVQLPGTYPDEQKALQPLDAGESAVKSLTAVLGQALKDKASVNDLIKLALQSLSQDFGFNRCLLLLPDTDKKRMLIRAAPGFPNSPLLKRARPRIDKRGIFSSALSKPQAIWIHDENYPRIAPSVPEEFSTLTKSANFMLFSIAIEGKPLGLIYTDMSGHPIGTERVKEAKNIAALLSRSITQAVRQA